MGGHNFITSLLILILALTHCTEGNIYEMRCKCVCPQNEEYQLFTANQTVFIAAIGGPSECICRYVVGVRYEDQVTNKDENEYIQQVNDICNKCQCTYEQRLHLINQVVIYVILILLAAMSIYTLVVVIVNAFRNRTKPGAWMTIPIDTDELLRSHSYKVRIRNRLSRWQDQVAKQRSVVYGIPEARPRD